VSPPHGPDRKESKFLALKAAGFTNPEIIAAYKAGKLAELLALVDDVPEGIDKEQRD